MCNKIGTVTTKFTRKLNFNNFFQKIDLLFITNVTYIPSMDNILNSAPRT